MKKVLLVLLLVVMILSVFSVTLAAPRSDCPYCGIPGLYTGNQRLLNGKTWYEFKCGHMHKWWAVQEYGY